MSRDSVRLNAYVAVADDVVLRASRIDDLRLGAAVMLAPRVEVCEALLAGLPVPADRLDPRWVRRLRLSGDIVLDPELALRVVVCGPMEGAR